MARKKSPLDIKEMFYRLDKKEIVECGFEDAMLSYSICKTGFKDILVSTVFLGINHNFGQGKPILFETMIFGGSLDGKQWRHTEYDEAEEFHKTAVQMAIEADAKSFQHKIGTEVRFENHRRPKAGERLTAQN